VLVAVKVVLVAFAGTLAAEGTVTAALSLASEIVSPPAGAPLVRIAVQFAEAPARIIAGVQVTDATCTWVVTVSDVDFEEPSYEAVIDAV
jgi:hypothetical protein